MLTLTLAAGCGKKEGPAGKTPASKSIEGLNVKEVEVSQYVNQAIEQNDKGNYTEALDLLKKAYESDNADESIRKGITTVYSNLCAVLVKSGEYEWAERNLEEALELIPVNPDMEKKYALVLAKHAQSEFGSGNRQNAVKLLETAVIHDGSNADILGLLGDYYYKTDNNTGAIECCEKALALNPADYGLQKKT